MNTGPFASPRGFRTGISTPVLKSPPHAQQAAARNSSGHGLQWRNPTQMPIPKPAPTRATAQASKRFSLVPVSAQQQMYEALTALKPARPGTASDAAVVEIAVCLAIEAGDPVILAYPARAVRVVRKSAIRTVKSSGARLAAATIAAVAALLGDREIAAAVICAGALETHAEAREDFRSSFRFAARHKLPILFVVANGWTRGRRQQLDLRTLYAEFGIPVFSVDANDAIAAYRVATEALHNARHLRGPCVIEALTVHGKGGSEASALDLLGFYMERHGNRPRQQTGVAPVTA